MLWIVLSGTARLAVLLHWQTRPPVPEDRTCFMHDELTWTTREQQPIGILTLFPGTRGKSHLTTNACAEKATPPLSNHFPPPKNCTTL
jgi:hypothetical protein